MKNKFTLRNRALLCALSGAFGLTVAMPAFADAEVDALKKELAEQNDALKKELTEQKLLIQKLLAAQETQGKAIAKVETKTAAAPVAAPAASSSSGSVSFYGVADVGVSVTNTGMGNKTSIISGGMNSSRLGVKGERDLGNGMKAVGLAEAGLLINNGSVSNAAPTLGLNQTSASSGGQSGAGSQIFSRQIYAGLSSDKYGTATLGRQYSGSYGAAVGMNAMGVGFYGYAGYYLPYVGGFPTRVNNSVLYTSPKLSGFTTQFMLTTGSQNNVDMPTLTSSTATTMTTSKAGRGYDLAVSYSDGPIYAAVTTWSNYAASYAPALGETDLAKQRGVQTGGSYDFGVIRLFGSFTQGTIKGGGYENATQTRSKASAWSLSAAMPFGKHKVLASYTDFNDRSVQNKDAKIYGLAYTYDLLANTKLYAAWGYVDNNQKATYSLADSGDVMGNVTKAGTAAKGLMLGTNISW